MDVIIRPNLWQAVLENTVFNSHSTGGVILAVWQEV